MKPKVILRRCPEYEPARIARIIGEGMDELGVRPRGRALVKPNCVIAHRKFFSHAYTRPEFLDGLLQALQARGGDVTELAVGERSGITVPTRYAFAEAGYPAVLRRRGVRAYYFDEVPQMERPLSHPHALRQRLSVAQPVARCDFFVNAPKFKAHPWTKVTFALKNYVGIQDDRHRLIDHDYRLETKIVDLQEVIAPSLIVVDGVIAGQQTMLTPTSFPLGLIILGVNPVAVDSVCARIAGLDPREVSHIRIAHERGLGPVDLSDIELSGDVTLDEARSMADGFRLTLDRVEGIFNGGRSNLTVYAGPPWDPELADYCWGGCPGALVEAMHVVRVVQPGVFHEVRPMHIVFGRYEGQVTVRSGERVVLVGDCAGANGQVAGRSFNVQVVHGRSERREPRPAPSADLLVKLIGAVANVIRHRGKQVVRVRGCPVSVAETVLYLALLGGTANPYLHSSIVFRFAWHYGVSRLARLWRVGLGMGK